MAVVLSTRPKKVAELEAETAATPTSVTPVPAAKVAAKVAPALTITNSNVEPTPSPVIAVKMSAAVAVVRVRAADGVIVNSRLEMICEAVNVAAASVSTTAVAF